jgi:hypothetical protein
MSATVDIDTKLFVLTGIASLSTLANVIASKLYGPGHSHCSILVGGCLLFVSEFFFVFEEMLGWQQKALWCSHIFLHSLIFWIENTLHPFICNIFIQICQFHPCFGNFWCWFGFFIHFLYILVPKTWCHLIIFGAIWL